MRCNKVHLFFLTVIVGLILCFVIQGPLSTDWIVQNVQYKIAHVMQPLLNASNTENKNPSLISSKSQFPFNGTNKYIPTPAKLKGPVYPDREIDISCRNNVEGMRNVAITPQEGSTLYDWYKSVDDYFMPNRTDPITLPEDEGINMFTNYHYSNPSMHTLSDSSVQYFHMNGDAVSCYIKGTDKIVAQTNGSICKCLPDFVGPFCSVPKTVEYSRKNVLRKYEFKPRKVPRRVICAMTFNMEHIILLLKCIQSSPAVDLFVILESNLTNFGDPKPLYLLPALKRGFLRKWHNKIMHMFTSEFVPEARIKGRGFAQEVHIRSLFAPAIKQRVGNIRDDDLFIFFDADESPGLDELMFLKLHDGYPFPVGFHMDLFRYGLYWYDQRVKWRAMGVTTMKYFQDVYGGNANALRAHVNTKRNPAVKNFGTDPLHEIWVLGSDTNCVGWHLTFFGTPGQVYTKIMSVINADWPRWANDPVNRNVTYIATLFRKGTFFDKKYNYVNTCPQKHRVLKNLDYVFKYPNFFNYLLVNPTMYIPT